MRNAIVSVAVVVVFALLNPLPSHAQRATQMAPDDATLLVNKRLGQQQWAIVLNFADQTGAGNVFNLDGNDPQFVWCEIVEPTIGSPEDLIDVTVRFNCFVAAGCEALPCGGDAWTPVGERLIVGSFFLPPTAHVDPTPSATPTPTPMPIATPFCGNGACNANETCSTCASDCGPCAEFCGDGFCQALRESCVSCPDDCACPPFCGDGICNGFESCLSCGADCHNCAG